MSKGFVYALHLPASPFRYVGMTRQDPRLRLQQHRRNGRSPSRILLRQWMHEVGPYLVEMTVLEEVAEGLDLGEREKFHIVRLRSEGAELLNGTSGGQRGSVGYVVTPEERARRSALMQGNKIGYSYVPTPEHREKLRAALVGSRCPEGCACGRHIVNPDRGAKISAAKRKQ